MRQTHPDKNNGDARNFNVVKTAFKKLHDDYLLKKNDKQFNELKSDFRDFYQHQKPVKHTNFDKTNFNITKFNKIYDEYKLKIVLTRL